MDSFAPLCVHFPPRTIRSIFPGHGRIYSMSYNDPARDTRQDRSRNIGHLRGSIIVSRQTEETETDSIMDRFIDKMVGVASGRNVLIFFIPSLAVYLLMLFHTIPGVESYAPEMKIFDLSPSGYSYDYAVKLLSALGNDGRKEYLSRQLPLDFIYPALFSISSFLMLAWLFLKRNDKGSRIFYLCFVPIVAGIFDYLENIQIVLMILSYPDINKAQVVLSSAFTMVKSGLTSLFFFILLFAFIRLWVGSKSTKARSY